jgi:DNA gyrase subunit A
VVSILELFEDAEIAVFSSDGRAAVFSSALLSPKSTRSTQGVQVISLKRGRSLESAMPLARTPIANPSRYRVRSIPAAGALLKPEDRGEEQMGLSLESSVE